jgi:hypothetical protein
MTRHLPRLLLVLAVGFGLLGIAPPGQEEAPPAEPAAIETSRSTSVMAGYDPDRAGHPLRIVAYVLHPVGVILDYALYRPAYWLGSHEPLRTLFGRDDE